jgi:hypothetical protein
MFADRGGLPRQEQERGLEAVLGVFNLVKHSSADTQNHWPMPPNERGKCVLIATGQERGKQLTVSFPDVFPGNSKLAKRMDGSLQL